MQITSKIEYNDKRMEVPFEDYDNSVVFERQPPYGMWSIHFSRGDTPAHLKGTWTSYVLAHKAVKAYLEGRGTARTSIPDSPPTEAPKEVIKSQDTKPKKK